MLAVKSVLVIGHGGCRMDFVAGWLGKLDGFVDTRWYVNPDTGESYGERTTKMIDVNNNSIAQELLKFGYILTDNAALTVASGCHGFTLNDKLIGCNNNNLRIIRINFAEEYINKIIWDFIVKTFLCSPQTNESVRARIEVLQLYMPLLSIDIDFPTIDVNYEQLLSIDGAYYIANHLGLTPTAPQYKLWQDALLVASSPEIIELHGQTWRKQDFF